MSRCEREIGVLVPNIMLPEKTADFYRWAVVACDQYTSQPDYWNEARSIIGEAPSTLDLILPEAYLGKPDEAERIAKIRESMRTYLDNGILQEREAGFVLVTRSVAGNTRHGLVMALDLEQYDYHKGATTLIRATEGTIEDRIPPRLRIRAGAPVELPHILVLIDDPEGTVIEPLLDDAAALPLLYDTDLMLDGGHITGRLVSDDAHIDGVMRALAALTDADAFHAKYGEGHAPLLFAMGDGNHSFATAKANWEAIKKTLSKEEIEDHPARYALVEVENVHDAGIIFEPIHRVVFGIDGTTAAEKLLVLLKEQNGDAEIVPEVLAAEGGKVHTIPYFTKDSSGSFRVTAPSQQLAVGTLQQAIDALLKEQSDAEVDYIHGADVVKELSAGEKAIGFLLPAMAKSELFPTVVYDGALPRKTFSMGEANEKRYYMECRRISE